jgi:protein O-GlcNAc transferase
VKTPFTFRNAGAGAVEKIKIGYVSSDFGNHPLSHLMMSVWRNHNRKNFTIYMFSLTKDDGSEYFKLSKSFSDYFYDISDRG